MRTTNVRWPRLLAVWSLAVSMVAFSLSSPAHEPGQTIPEPGFRPDSEYAAAFVNSASGAKIAVLPTIVRRVDRTAHSFASQQQLVTLLNESGVLTAESKPLRIKMPPLRRPSQWEIFQFGVDSVSAKLETYDSGTDYVLVLEILVPGDGEVFGIEVYILDPQGENAFSFLLNSHHRMFADANLAARDSTQGARSKIIEEATQLAVLALRAQIERAQESLDDARLRSSAATEAPQPGTEISHRMFVETSIDKVSSRLTVDPGKFKGLAAEKALELSCECAKLTTDRGFRYYRIDERTELSGGRGSFRIHFYNTPPEGIPVVGTNLDEDLTQTPDPATAVLDAEEFVRMCRMLASQSQAPN